jgi:ABC-2 type transport system permease protein
VFYHHLRNELWKLFGKKRTYIGFGAFVVVQNAILILIRFTHVHNDIARQIEGNGYLAEEYISALTVAVIMLIPQILLLMPLYAALVGGDIVAKEAEDGTLRMILSRPISRARLLFVKWASGVIFSIVLVVVLGVTAVCFARIWFPWRGMFVAPPGTGVFSLFTAGKGLGLYAASHIFLAINASAVTSLGFMFGCFNMKPAAATILAISFLFINLVLEMMPFFERFHEWLILYHFRAWLLVYAQPMPWDRILGSFGILLAFNVTAFLIGVAAFQARDIKS